MKTIVETAAEAGQFTTLLAAVNASGLKDTLNGKGPFTVFAPTDEAFKKVQQSQLDALLKDTAKLKSILRYHVVPGKVEAKDIKAGNLNSVEGSPLNVEIKGDEVRVNGAKVVKTDIQASNGTIHVIDTVIMPKGTKLSEAA
jgi:uncharacterized surface protein with fasciclin (FAS1) repeats